MKTIAVRLIVALALLGIGAGAVYADSTEPELKTNELYYDNGQIKLRYTYYLYCLTGSDPCTSWGSKRHGIETYWWETGQKEYEITYEHGVKIRKIDWDYFYDPYPVMLDQPSSRKEMKYVGDSTVLDGVSTYYFQSGEIQAEKTYQEGLLTYVREKFASGQIQNQGTYENGLKTGEWIEGAEWFGTKRWIETYQGPYVNGIRQGVWKIWYESPWDNIPKYLKEEGEYANNERTRVWQGWYPGGANRYRGSYNAGIVDGSWAWWGADGSYVEGGYNFGAREGAWTWEGAGTRLSAYPFPGYSNAGAPGADFLSTYFMNPSASLQDHLFSSAYNATRAAATYSRGVLNGTLTLEGGGTSVSGLFKAGEPQGKWGDNLTWYTYAYGVKHGPYRTESAGGTTTGWYANDSACGPWVLIRYGDQTTGSLGPCGPLETYPADSKTVKGVVSDLKKGNVIAGATVRIGAETVTSGPGGDYLIALDKDATEATLASSKTGYLDYTLPVNLSSTDHRVINIAMSKPVEKPLVTLVKSKYGNVFLGGISLQNEYQATVYWRGQDPGIVEFNNNGVVTRVQGTEAGASITYDMGTDFRAALDTYANRLTVVAVIEDERSDPVVLHPIVLPVPPWSLSLGSFGNLEYSEGLATYSLDYSYPDPPFALQVSPKTLGPSLWTAWGYFPLIGGREFGLIETQAAVGLAAATDGTGSIGLTGQTGFTAAGQQIVGTLGGKGYLQYTPNSGLGWTQADFTLGVNGTIEKTVGPISLIPALENAEDLWLIGDLVKWFNKRAEITGKINAGAEVTLIMIVNDQDILVFKNTEGQISSGISLGMAVEISSDLSAEIEGGASVKVYLVAPADPDYVKEITATLHAALKLIIFSYEKEWSKEHTFPESRSATALALDTEGFKPVSRRFLTRGGYNRFAGDSARRKPLERGGRVRVVRDFVRQPSAVGGQTGEQLLVENVYPYSTPSIAEKDGAAMIAYVYSDPSDQVLQSTDIYYSIFDGSTYSVPAPIMDDTRSEFNPALAYDANGNVVAAWERVKNDSFAGELEDMVKEMEIVWSAYRNGSWSIPQALTDNNHLDHAPMLASSPEGSIMLLWRSNTGSELIGSSTSPDTVYYALWDGSAFSAPQPLGQAITDSLKFSAAYSGTNAVLAYAKDTDGDLSTLDEDIFYHTFNGNTWSAAIQATSDAEWADTNPKALYDTGGHLQLVWLKQRITGEGSVEGKLVRLLPSGGYETIRENSSSVTFTDFSAFMDPLNRLTIVWGGIAGDGAVDLFYSVYDAPKGVWSKDLRLTNDLPAEKSVDGLFGTDGTLQLVYSKRIGDGSIRNQTIQNDLYHLTWRFGSDLLLMPNSLSITPANPQPNSLVELTCQVYNNGDLALENVTVSFYEGDPGASGQLIGTSMVNGAIKAGESAAASVNWTVPEYGASVEVFAVVDADSQIPELDETNNKTRFYPIKMDLELLGLRAEKNTFGDVETVAVIKNNGAFAAGEYGVGFSADGNELINLAGPVIRPGNQAEISYVFMKDLEVKYNQTDIEVSLGPEGRITRSQRRLASIILQASGPLELAVNTLKLLSGMETDSSMIADINGDDKISLAEAIYYLQEEAELR